MRGWTAVLAALVVATAAAQPITPDARRSGAETMSPQLQAMQRDDLANPAMLAAGDGEQLWNSAPKDGKSCHDCHGAANTSMKGVALRYPAFDAASGRILSLSARIEQCRSERQTLPPLASEAPQRVALEAHIALQSRGLPLPPLDDARLTQAIARGKMLYFQRLGQLDLSCAQCHDDNHGKRLGGSVIPQGHPTGYPLYRLEWQTTGTLARRIRNCLTGIRAQPFAADAPEMTALELYLKQRATGMISDAPGVRP